MEFKDKKGFSGRIEKELTQEDTRAILENLLKSSTPGESERRFLESQGMIPHESGRPDADNKGFTNITTGEYTRFPYENQRSP